MKSKVTIIIPVFNRPTSIGHCIESIRNLNYQHWKLIVVDDGSTDDTLAVCKQLANQDMRITVTTQANGGVSKARNKGIELADGDWILFVDSDDVLAPDFLDDLSAESGQEYDMFFFGRGTAKIKDDRVVFSKYQARSKCTIDGNRQVISFLFGVNDPYSNKIFFCTDKLFLLQNINDNGLRFDEDVDLGEDQIFVMGYLAKTGRLFYNPNRKYCRLCDGSKTIEHLAGRLRTPEKLYSIIMANYRSLYDIYLLSQIREVYDYAQDYLLDRLITKIIFSYCKPQNRLLLDEKQFDKFCSEKLIPLYKDHHNDYALVRDTFVRKVISALVYGGGYFCPQLRTL